MTVATGVPEKILVIVPTFNEAENIRELVAGIFKHAPSNHVLFVDDNSIDGTQAIIKELMGRYPNAIHLLQRAGKLGLGTAYLAGFRWAMARDYQAIIEMDADLSHDPVNLPRMGSLLAEHDVVVGSRYVVGGGTSNWGMGRRFISQFGSFYSRAILGLTVRDLTGGFNGWRRKTLESIDLNGVQSEGYAFQIELKYRAHLAGARLVEMPIVFVDRRAGSSKMSSKIVFEAIFRVWQLKGLNRKSPS